MAGMRLSGAGKRGEVARDAGLAGFADVELDDVGGEAGLGVGDEAAGGVGMLGEGGGQQPGGAHADVVGRRGREPQGAELGEGARQAGGIEAVAHGEDEGDAERELIISAAGADGEKPVEEAPEAFLAGFGSPGGVAAEGVADGPVVDGGQEVLDEAAAGIEIDFGIVDHQPPDDALFVGEGLRVAGTDGNPLGKLGDEALPLAAADELAGKGFHLGGVEAEDDGAGLGGDNVDMAAAIALICQKARGDIGFETFFDHRRPMPSRCLAAGVR